MAEKSLMERLVELLDECGLKPWIKSPQQQARENKLIAITKELQTEIERLKGQLFFSVGAHWKKKFIEQVIINIRINQANDAEKFRPSTKKLRNMLHDFLTGAIELARK